MITIQYLEDSPDLSHLGEKAVVERLRAAHQRLPFTHLLVGWHVPPALLEGCRLEARRLGIRFLRWQPLLAGDASLVISPAWRAVTLAARHGEGFEQRTGFDFICPNHPEVQQALFQHILDLLHQELYDGFFLDRLRFSSPSSSPLKELGCFCEHCIRKAAVAGLDLDRTRALILERTLYDKGRITLVQALLGGKAGFDDPQLGDILVPFLRFREQYVLDFLSVISHPLADAHMEVGLDCFSPALAKMVGQDLASLGHFAGWIKLMTYAHTFAPAGIPYELAGLYDYLVSTTSLEQADALSVLEAATGVPLPPTREGLVRDGISSPALAHEVERGMELCRLPVLAGLELVDLAGVTHLNPAQLESDLRAIQQVSPAGLSLSWDLRHIPLERLSLVRQVYQDS